MQATRSHITHVSTDIQLQIAEQKSLQLLLYLALTRCATHLQNVIQMIVVANIALYSSIIGASRSARALPTTISFDAPAVLEDAFGQNIPIHTQCITSWKVTCTSLYLQQTRTDRPRRLTSSFDNTYLRTCNSQNLLVRGVICFVTLKRTRRSPMEQDSPRCLGLAPI
jgi:hypothetical protein